MAIISSSARIEGSSAEKGSRVFMDSLSEAYGYCAGVQFYPKWHYIVLCRDKNDSSKMALLSLPSSEWEDSIDERWEIVQRLSESK